MEGVILEGEGGGVSHESLIKESILLVVQLYKLWKDAEPGFTYLNLEVLLMVIIFDSIRPSLIRKCVFKFITKDLISSFHIHQELSCSSLAQLPYEPNQTNSKLILNRRTYVLNYWNVSCLLFLSYQHFLCTKFIQYGAEFFFISSPLFPYPFKEKYRIHQGHMPLRCTRFCILLIKFSLFNIVKIAQPLNNIKVASWDL